MKARVFVTLKPSVFDPQGSTIAEALHSLGYGAVADVRQGKYFDLDLAVAPEDARHRQMPGSPGDECGSEIRRPKRPGRCAVEIGAEHGTEKQQRHRHVDRELRERVAGLSAKIAGSACKIAETDETKDEEGGFDERGHAGALR